MDINNFWDELFKPRNKDIRKLILEELGSKGRRGLGMTGKKLYELLGGREKAIEDYMEVNKEYIDVLKDKDEKTDIEILETIQNYKMIGKKYNINELINRYNKDNNFLISIMYLLKNRDYRGDYSIYIDAIRNRLPDKLLKIIIEETFSKGAKYFYTKYANGMLIKSLNQLIDSEIDDNKIINLINKYSEKYE